MTPCKGIISEAYTITSFEKESELSSKLILNKISLSESISRNIMSKNHLKSVLNHPAALPKTKPPHPITLTDHHSSKPLSPTHPLNTVAPTKIDPGTKLSRSLIRARVAAKSVMSWQRHHSLSRLTHAAAAPIVRSTRRGSLAGSHESLTSSSLTHTHTYACRFFLSALAQRVRIISEKYPPCARGRAPACAADFLHFGREPSRAPRAGKIKIRERELHITLYYGGIVN